MALKRQMCSNHAERLAIGVCVMTGKPICAECSTQYEGVNYSKEGLAMLQAQRGAAAARKARGRHVMLVLGLLMAPLMLMLVYQSYYLSFISLIDLQQFEWSDLGGGH